MRRTLLPLVLFAVALAACAPNDGGEGSPSTSEPAPASSTTSAPTVTQATGGGATTTSPSPGDTMSGRPLAPGFTLELGEGGTYTLGEEGKPVFLVFWAEW